MIKKPAIPRMRKAPNVAKYVVERAVINSVGTRVENSYFSTHAEAKAFVKMCDPHWRVRIFRAEYRQVYLRKAKP